MPEKTLSEVFGDIANAIREKTESQETMTPLEMADEISSILKPSGTITISESGSYNVAEYAEADVEVAGFEPEDSGWYYYDTDSKWYDQPSIPANTLVYATERGDECIYPDLYSDYAYIYDGTGGFEAMDGVYETDQGYYNKLDAGLYWVDDNDNSYSLSLQIGDYSYNGGSDFYPLERPQQDGYYWFSSSSGWDPFDCGTAIIYPGIYDLGNGMTDHTRLDDGLYYVENGEYYFANAYTINLTSGSTYTYEGGSTFEPYQGGGGFEPESSGWYYYDTQSKWYDQPSIPADTLVYATGRGDECVFPEIQANSAYVYKGQGSFTSAASEGYLIPTGSTTITVNGTYNIASLASVDVQVDSSVSGTKEVYLQDEEGLNQSIDVANYSNVCLKYSNYQDFEEGYWYHVDRHYYGDPLRFDAFDNFSEGDGLYYFYGGGSDRRGVSLEYDKTYLYKGSDTFIESPSIEVDKLYTYGQYGAIDVTTVSHDVALIVIYGGKSEGGDSVGQIDMSDMEVGEERSVTIDSQHRYKLTRLPDEGTE